MYPEFVHYFTDTRPSLIVPKTCPLFYRHSPQFDFTDSRPSLIVPRQSGGYIVTHGTSVSHLDWPSGVLTTLESIEGLESDVKVCFNDGKCDSTGRLWAGTMPADINGIETIPPNKGFLTSVAKGSVKKHAGNITLSNGMAWTADERTFYFVDTIAGEILAFDFDVTSGQISNRRVAIKFPAKDSEDTLGVPDGLTIDSDGNLWVACVFVGKITCFDPRTGKVLRSVQLPVKATTSCCFGGQNMDELFVTSGYRDRFNEELGGENPPGAIYKITGLGVKGIPDHVYQY